MKMYLAQKTIVSGIELIIYEDKKATSEDEKYFVRFAVCEGSPLIKTNPGSSKSYIKTNYLKVWNASLNVLSWAKVNELLKTYN